jgi:hypothetical protein
LRGTARWVMLDIGARWALLGRGREARACYYKIIRAERLARRVELSGIAQYRLNEILFMPHGR